MTKKHICCAWCAFVLVSLLTACGPAAGPDRHPFSLHIAGGDGAEVTWESYTEDFRPGTMETMHLAVQNNTDQHWDGRLCVQLLEPRPSSEVFPLTQLEFDLEPGGGFSRDVSVDLPAELSSGTYGLALVVHQPSGPIVDVIPVQVGEGEREPFQGEWPTEAALAVCPAPESGDEGQPPGGRITIEGVEVTAAQVVVRGKSTLPDGTCVSTELWADGALQTWWPTDACAPIEQGAWELVVPLETGQALQPGVQYMVRAYQPGGPDIVNTFPFDLDGPPTPPGQVPEEQHQ